MFTYKLHRVDALQAQWLDGWQASHVARSAAALGLAPGGPSATAKRGRNPAFHGKTIGKPWKTYWKLVISPRDMVISAFGVQTNAH